MRGRLAGAVIVAVLCAAPAFADDPKDPAMRTRAAREADRAAIRKLNRDQLAAVRKRDAGYAEGWAAWRAARDPEAANADYAARRAQHRRALDAYGRAQDDYARRMADWRRAVAACRAGDWSACED